MLHIGFEMSRRLAVEDRQGCYVSDHARQVVRLHASLPALIDVSGRPMMRWKGEYHEMIL
jgi:hypothetical protein